MNEGSFRLYTMDKGQVLELTVNLEEQKCVLRKAVKESHLAFEAWEKRDFRVSGKLFYSILNATSEWETETIVDGEESEAFVVPKQAVWAALRQELDQDKMATIAYFDDGVYEADDYYDYGLLVRGFQRYCDGEVSGEYFTEWCHVCTFCFQNMKWVKKARLYDAYRELGDLFETMAFLHCPRAKSEYKAWRNDILARLRYCNFVIECAKNDKIAEFTTNGVATFVTFGCYSEGGNKPIDRALVVDYDLKKFNCFYLPEVVFDEDVNYSFLDAEKLDKKLHAQINFKMDATMRINYAKKKGEKK